MSTVPGAGAPQLVRVIGRWSLAALALNSVLGSGIFGLPSAVAERLGRLSAPAMVLAALGMAVIVACYAEVSSQFTGTGGTYLYVRRAFGRLVGIEVGWLTLLARLTGCAAAVNLFVAYLGEFWPGALEPLARIGVESAVIGILAAINYRGVGAGARMSSAALLGKLAPLALVCVAGVVYLGVHGVRTAPPPTTSVHGWLEAGLMLLFAYGGYEAALNPMGEARDPRRDAAFALFVALGVVALLYGVLQLVVVGVLADPAHSSRPLADAARTILGPWGAALVAAGALLSVYGFLSANLLTVPRGMYALAEQGDFPAWLAGVHPRWRTPHRAIVIFALLLWVFAVSAGFAWNVTLSAVARLFYYGAVCAAVPVLRRLEPQAQALRIPGGLALPVAGVLICATLLAGVDFSKSVLLGATVLVALGNWLLVRRA